MHNCANCELLLSLSQEIFQHTCVVLNFPLIESA
jgi:hypothetical protein